MPQLLDFLSASEIEKYKSQGFTEQDLVQAISELQQEETDKQTSVLQQSYTKAMQQQQNDSRNYASQTLISGSSVQDNLIKWQLELDSILERVEHMLRGDKPRFINGNLIFVTTDNDNEKILNDFGVSEIMRILSMYLNRNTILSNYDETTINFKVFDFGNEIADLFFLKYENMGLNTLEKRKLYPMIIRELVDTVHSSYLRALHGGERQSLHEQRSVNQQETIVPQGMGFSVGGQPVMRERSILNPLRYFGGKYK
jgi:hypothetical protein